MSFDGKPPSHRGLTQFCSTNRDCPPLPDGAVTGTPWPLSRDVVLLATADWDHPFWTNKQRMARELARRGFRVLYVESLGLRAPALVTRDVSRVARRLRRAVRPIRQVAENVWVVSPLALPWHGAAMARAVNQRLVDGSIVRVMRRLSFARPIVWTYNPLSLPLARRLDGSLLIYHAVDDLSAAPRLPAEAIRAGERELAAAADVVFATSPNIADRLRRENPSATYYLPNVADYDHFARAAEPGTLPPDLAAIPSPRIGFVGAISQYKLDFELIAQVAVARPDWHWVFVGPVGEGDPNTNVDRLRLPNVHLLGPRVYDELPNYLRGFDVATIPARANGYTAAMFPLKFFEYLAAGLPVVASHVPALAEFSPAYIAADSLSAFRAAIQRVLSGNRPDPALCRSLAQEHTWQARTDRMLSLIAGRSQPPAPSADFATNRRVAESR